MRAMVLEWPWARKKRGEDLAAGTGQRVNVWTAVALAAVVLLAGALRFYNLQALGYANTYYTAGVVAMLKSWHNFFFVAASRRAGRESAPEGSSPFRTVAAPFFVGAPITRCK